MELTKGTRVWCLERYFATSLVVVFLVCSTSRSVSLGQGTLTPMTTSSAPARSPTTGPHRRHRDSRRQQAGAGGSRSNTVAAGVLADRSSEHPAGVHVHGAGELVGQMVR